MQEFIRNVVPEKMNDLGIEIEDFIALYNEDQCELVDIRVPKETRVWQVNFGLRIPAPELPERLSELPRDRLIVVACPKTTRASMTQIWLSAQGYNVKYLYGGLTGLVDYLKGGKAKAIHV